VGLGYELGGWVIIILHSRTPTPVSQVWLGPPNRLFHPAFVQP